ncbi:chaperonin 10-like protein [Aspergillus floccosus]
MKAAQWDPSQGRAVVNTIPMAQPAPNQILVKMASASLCHSDLLCIERPGLTEPFTIGHEGAGYVVEVGSAVPDKGFKSGDPVGFLYINDCCFECEGCQVHNMNCTRGQPAVAGFGKFGFFAEYAAVDWQNVIALPSVLPPEKSSAIFCAGITAFNCVDSCELKPGQWLAVVGAGGLGQLGTQYAKAMGLNVAAIDINDDALALCKKQGADVTINSTSTTYVEDVKAATGGGVHAATIFAGSNPAYKSALPILRCGGLLMAVGIAPQELGVSTMDLVTGVYRIRGDSTGIPSRMPRAVEFTAKHGIMPEVDIRPGLETVDSMVSEMREGRSSRRMGVVFDK